MIDKYMYDEKYYHTDSKSPVKKPPMVSCQTNVPSARLRSANFPVFLHLGCDAVADLTPAFRAPELRCNKLYVRGEQGM